MAYNLIPMFIAALAAGATAQYQGNKRARKAQERAYSDYASRTDKRTDEAKAIFEKSLGEQDVKKQQARVDEAATAKTARVDDLVARESSYIDPMLPGQDRAPKVIKQQASRALGDELARARAQIAAIAKLEGFSTRTFDRGLELDHVKPQLGNLSLFAQGDRNIFEARSAVAANKGANLRMLGDILIGIGAMGLGGAMGGAAGAGAGGASSVIGNQAQASPYVNSSVRMV